MPQMMSDKKICIKASFILQNIVRLSGTQTSFASISSSLFLPGIFQSSLSIFFIDACSVFMAHSMSTYINFSVEAPSTDLAGEWFYSCVSPHVCQHVGWLTKNLATLLTLERLDSRMHQSMLLHVGLAKKVLSTITTRVGLMIRVNQFMCGKTRGSLEFFPTFQALIDFRFYGDRLVWCNFVAVFSGLSPLNLGESRGCPIARETGRGKEGFLRKGPWNKRWLMNDVVEVHCGWIRSKTWTAERVRDTTRNSAIPRDRPKNKRWRRC